MYLYKKLALNTNYELNHLSYTKGEGIYLGCSIRKGKCTHSCYFFRSY